MFQGITKNQFYLILFVALALVVILAACGAPTLGNLTTEPPTVQNATPGSPASERTTLSSAQTGSIQPTGNLAEDVGLVAGRTSPAVVFIGIQANVRQFSEPIPVGNGSGAIIDAEGNILTNNHVVAGAQALQVTLPDGRTFDAEIVGRDPATDLAVIKIQGDNLPTIPLGDSATLNPGEFVIAIGNALGLEGGPTVTVGVVSALNRTIQDENGASISGLIQTDAAINPGNSGGPLVNLNGELVGINTATAGATSEGFQPSGIGFAISINEAKPILQELLTQGRVVRPYLGIVPVTLTAAIRAQLGLEIEKGVILANVSANSPAAAAGLRQGDVVISADNSPVATDQELRRAIQAHRIGDIMQLTIVRDGEPQQQIITVTLAESPAPG